MNGKMASFLPQRIAIYSQIENYRDVELTTWMRLGEICGLKWQDFEKKTGRFHIRRSVHRRKGGGVRVRETKTETGTRTILLLPSTMEILKARKKKSYSGWIFYPRWHRNFP